jgi:hypothetical protein
MLNEANFSWSLRHTMWAYSLLHDAKLDNLLIRLDTFKSLRYVLWENITMGQALALFWRDGSG